MKSYKNINEYIAQADKDKQALLKEVRKIVKAAAKDAQECIAYGMPAYKWKEKPLFYFASMKGHLGLYPTSGPIQTCKDLLQKFSTSKGCVRIPYKEKLPKSLIVTLIKTRMKEIQNS